MNPRRNSLIALVIGLCGLGARAWCGVAGARVHEAPGSAGQSDPRPMVAKPPQAPAEAPQAQLREAIKRLEGYRSVSARSRHVVDLFEKRLFGSGSYLEERSGQGLSFRVELKTQLGAQTSTFLEVCDGRYLWVYEECHGKTQVARVDVARLRRALEEQGDLAGVDGLENWPGLGGLARLLRTLDMAFEFTGLQETLLADQLPVVRLQGGWKRQKLARALGEGTDTEKLGKMPDPDRLPEHLPHYVVLFLERDSLFPRRVEFWRRLPAHSRQSSPDNVRLIVAMELFDVQIDLPIERARFGFDPGKLSVSDRTEAYLHSLGLGKK
ncbi:MAG: hypothetical protein ACUVUC_09555 [Thermoguttaceae bacterium]